MNPSPVMVVMVVEGRVVTTDLDDLFYRYRPSLLRGALERYGVPYGRQPPSARECVKLLAKRMGLVGRY